MIGRVTDDCTSATMSALGAIESISHEAPTDWIIEPKLDAMLASQIARNTGWRSDAKMDAPASSGVVDGFCELIGNERHLPPGVAARDRMHSSAKRLTDRVVDGFDSASGTQNGGITPIVSAKGRSRMSRP